MARSPALTAVSALLVAACGLAVGGSFAGLAEEVERAGGRTLTLTYTSWRLVQGGTFGGRIYFHAPHFGIPLTVAGALAGASGVLLVLGRWATAVRFGAVAAAGLLVGTVWTVGLVVTADLDAVTSGPGFTVTWRVGAGSWLVLAAGVAALLGAAAVLVQAWRRTDRPDPGRPVTDGPDPSRPETGQPDPGQPGINHPDPDQPERPDSGEPGADRPDSDEPATERPDTTQPVTDRSDTGEPV